MESESEESERFHFLAIFPLMTPTPMIQWKLECRSCNQKQKPKNQPSTMRGLSFGFGLRLQQSSFHWVISIGVISRIGRKWNRSDLTYDSDFQFSLGRKRLCLRPWLRLRLRCQWKPALNKLKGWKILISSFLNIEGSWKLILASTYVLK